MTEEKSKRDPVQPAGKISPEGVPSSVSAGQRSNAAAIAQGLDYVLKQCAHWDGSADSDPWVTACMLARLRELPEAYINKLLGPKIDSALDSLIRLRTAGGRRAADQDDAELLGRIIIALRVSCRTLPDGLLQAVGRCRQSDGGFALSPEDWSGSAPEVTVTAIQALRTIDRAAEDFLTARMQSGQNQMSSWLCVCAGILDWDKGLAPLPLLNQACRLVVRAQAQSAYEHALLLRCLLRLRLQQAWASAAELRNLQLENGSWPGPAPRRPAAGLSLNPDARNLIPTITAVSALALCESQPGLYFGSDLPRPRRLYES